MYFDLPTVKPVKKLSFIIVLAIFSATFNTPAANSDAAGSGAAAPGTDETTAIGDAVAVSVVKVFSTARYPDPYKPWTKQAPTEITGSGVVIKGRRILTNAHLVLYASQVQVQANQSGSLLSATVESIAPDIDLAVLRLDDETFFDSHPPLEWATTPPETENPVRVYGYPLGGTGLSITKGIVSRVEFAAYSNVGGLRIQIDAAINPGNSGGPAVVGSKMIGMAFSRLLAGQAQNIGYIIPCEEIEIFLHDVADGRYDGKFVMADEMQVLGNPTQRSFLNLEGGVHGVVVSRPDSLDLDYPLREFDVITKIGETPVDDQGMVNLDNNLRVFFKYLIQKIAKDGRVPLTVMRAGKQIQVEFPVSRNHPRLISSLDGAYPPYFLYGPIVFSKATTEFINGLSAGAQGSTRLSLIGVVGNPLMARMGDKPLFPNEELVVVSSPFFPHRLSKGFANPSMGVVKTVNGIPIKNLGHLVEVLRDSQDKFITIEFCGRLAPPVVFPRKEMDAATDQILIDNDIRSQGSPDTMVIWDAKHSASK
jgi:S1-C subfamily serine protease